MDRELREYLDKIRDSLLKSYEETRSDLRALKTLTQDQIRKLDELSDPKSGVKVLETTHDNGADALTPAEETADIVPELTASAASAKPIDIDTTGVAAPTTTSCSTDGLNHNADRDDPMAVCQDAWSTPTSFTVPRGDSPTPSREPALGLALGALAHTKYSTECPEVSTNSMVLASMSGAARSAVVTTVLLVDIQLDTAKSHEVVPVITNSNGLGEELRPLPWPWFACSHEGVTLKHAGRLPQVTYVMKYLSGDLNSLRASSRYLPSVQLKPGPFKKLVCWIPAVPRDIPVPSQPIMEFMDDLNLVATEWRSVLFSVQPSYEFHAQDAQPMFGFTQKNVQLKLPWPSLSCKCRAVQVWSELHMGRLPDDYCSSVTIFCSPVTTSVDDLGSLEFIEDQFLVTREHFRKLASHLWLEKLWSTRDLVCKNQEQWNLPEHAAVCSIPRCDKLQGTVQIVSMSVHWNFFSQEEFKGSGCFARGCSSQQHGDLLVLLSYLTVQHIHSLRFCCSAKLLPPTVQLSVDFKLDSWAPAECSMKCFVETPCALTPMFMPEVTESIKQQSHVLRPLPWPSFVQSQDEGQLNDTRSLESLFGFCVTEAGVSRFLGLTLGDDTSYGAYKNIIPCRPRFQAKLHEDDCCSALSFALHTTSSCIVVYSQVLSEMRLLYFELPGIGMSWTYVQLIGASGRLFPALESVATSIVFMSRETDEVQPWAYPFCMENLLLICPCSQPTSLQFRSSRKLGFSLATLISLHYVILTVEGATGYLHSLQPKPPWLSNVPATFIQVAIEVKKRGVQNLAEQQKERAQMTELLKQQLNHANQKMKHRAGANRAEFRSGVRVHGCDQISDFLHEKQTAYSCAKLVATQLLVSARTECWIPLLLIHAYLGGFCRLKWDIRITVSSSILVAIVQDVARGAFFNWGINYLECLSRKFVLGAINMPFPIPLTSKLCTTGGIIFTSSGPLIPLRNCEQIIYLESTSATYTGFLPDQIASLYSAQTVAVFGGSLGTASPLPCHCSIAKGAQYPYACCVRDITPLELRTECSGCLLTDLVMRNSCTVPYITPAAPSNMLDLLSTSPREIYSRLIPVWVAPLLASKSASGCHLELSWDPGGNISSVWTSQSLEENASCRGMLIGGQNSVDAMEFSSSHEQALFQGGRSITVPASSTTTTTSSLSSTTTSPLSSTTTSMMLTSSTSLKSTSTNAHHRDYGSTMERHVPWYPGGNGMASAWGQAEFQEGRGVSDLSNWYKYMGWFLGSAHGPSPFVNCWELQV